MCCVVLPSRKHPFEYEQRAFHYLLGTPQWASRGLRKYQYSANSQRGISHSQGPSLNQKSGLGQGPSLNQGSSVSPSSPLHDPSLSEAYIRSHFRMFPQVGHGTGPLSSSSLTPRSSVVSDISHNMMY